MIRNWRAVVSRCLFGTMLFGSGMGLHAAADSQATRLPRIVSINLCADQLLLLLADSQQILALSTLSRERSGSVFHSKAMTYPQVEPIAEDIVPLDPDIVLTGPFSSRYTLSLLQELDVQVESLAVANSIEDMLDNVNRIGRLIHQEKRAQAITEEALLRMETFDETVSSLASNSNKTPRAAVYDANGYTVGSETIRGQAMQLAGWHNVALDLGIDVYGVLGLEELIHLQPDALIESPYSQNTYSRGQRLTHHPALRASGLNPLVIKVQSNHTICAGPWTLDVIQQLLDARSAL